jgi:hypothetical protein
MSLWARFKAWWEAVKAEEQAIAARRQQARAEAILAGASTLGGHGEFTSGYQSPSGYHGPSSTDCGPGVSGDCSGTAV